MKGVYYQLLDETPPKPGWKLYLRRDWPDIWLRSWDEACDRHGYHERRNTPQTSGRERIPRDVVEEWNHLLGEGALSIMLGIHGVDCGPSDLNWGSTSAAAKQVSREGNVLPGVSVYVPKIPSGGLIIRKEEAEQYPDLIFVLVRRLRRMEKLEYLRAVGWRRAIEGWKSGRNEGWQGTPLRDPGDRLVRFLHPMDTLLDQEEVRI